MPVAACRSPPQPGWYYAGPRGTIPGPTARLPGSHRGAGHAEGIALPHCRCKGKATAPGRQHLGTRAHACPRRRKRVQHPSMGRSARSAPTFRYRNYVIRASSRLSGCRARQSLQITHCAKCASHGQHPCAAGLVQPERTLVLRRLLRARTRAPREFTLVCQSEACSFVVHTIVSVGFCESAFEVSCDGALCAGAADCRAVRE